MTGKINRRTFLKVLGLGSVSTSMVGCDLPSTVTLEEGKEDVVSYLMPEEYVIPGVGVWFASTCTQCAAGCGINGRVREGRVLKLEGNPDSPINNGKSCQMGQAGLQGHYNPDRITKPMMRENGQLVPIAWDKALSVLEEKVGSKSGINGDKVAWVTGSMSGHQLALLSNYLDSVGSKNHFSQEVVNTAVWQAVCKDMLGDSTPRIRIDKAQVVLSFGADFLGTWMSPVHFSQQYAQFRMPPNRGTLIQVESKMSLTGGSADFWVPIKPGTEGILAMGIANYILRKSHTEIPGVTAELRGRIEQFDIQKVAQTTGVAGDRIQRIGRKLMERFPSLVLAGASVEGHEQGYEAVAAVMLLNIILGNVGKTIEPSVEVPFSQLQSKQGNTRDLMAFAQAVKEKRFDVLFSYGANPVFNTPDALALKQALENVSFKVAISQFPDETTMMADLVLPVSSGLEDWGTHIAAYQSDKMVIGVQQPLMSNLYEDTRGLGDILLALLNLRQPDQYSGFKDYYAYLGNAFSALQDTLKDASSKKDFWERSLQKGVIFVDAKQKVLMPKVLDLNPGEDKNRNTEYPFHLVPSPRMGLYDGRHANLPWLQESPDQITKIVWDSWVEMHPSTARKLGVDHGDIVKVVSEHGAVEAKAYLVKAIHPEAIAIPLGQGHEEYGRYAKDVGVNPLKILSPVTENTTGELAMYATKVKISRTNKKDVLVKMGGSDTQHGRKFVRTVSVNVVKRTEGA